jgi:F420H(2)-dependent quinone reductase
VENKNNQVIKAQLTTKGRKTGKEHSVWLRAVLYDDKIYFSRHKLDGDWIKNAISNPDVKVEFDDSSFSGRATLVSDKNLAEKISELKYPGKERAKENRVVLEISLN